MTGIHDDDGGEGKLVVGEKVEDGSDVDVGVDGTELDLRVGVATAVDEETIVPVEVARGEDMLVGVVDVSVVEGGGGGGEGVVVVVVIVEGKDEDALSVTITVVVLCPLE